MEAWCLGAFIFCGLALGVGTALMYRARGMRIVSGRAGAAFAYVLLIAALVLVGFIWCVFAHIEPVLAANPELSGVLTPVLIASGPILLLALLCIWMRARSMGRSVVFYNVCRDDLAVAVADTLRQLGISRTHRLRTFKDEFVVAGGQIVVHGAIGMSRLEWIGLGGQVQSQIIDSAIARLRAKFEARGQELRDDRQARLVVA